MPLITYRKKRMGMMSSCLSIKLRQLINDLCDELSRLEAMAPRHHSPHTLFFSIVVPTYEMIMMNVILSSFITSSPGLFIVSVVGCLIRLLDQGRYSYQTGIFEEPSFPQSWSCLSACGSDFLFEIFLLSCKISSAPYSA